MARLKISQLQETTTPSSSDILPIVSGGTTKKVTLQTIYSGFGGGSDVSGLSANWQSTYTTVQSKSATEWNNALANQYVHANFLPLSGGTINGSLSVSGNITGANLNISNWNDVYNASSSFATNTTVSNVSSLLVLNTSFDTYKTNVAEATATLTPLTTTRTLTSALLPLAGGEITGNLTVLSAFHVGQGVIDFVVTEQGNVGINTESPNQKLTVIGNISSTGLIQTAVSVVTSSSTYTFSDSDSNRVYHFETVSPLSAIFPGSLAQGFNVTIMNTGTGTLYLSAPSYKALSNVLLDQYSGAFVYKQGSDIFAVGGL